MRLAGLVESIPGPDARSRIVALTPAGRELVPLLRAEWAEGPLAAVPVEVEGEPPAAFPRGGRVASGC